MADLFYTPVKKKILDGEIAARNLLLSERPLLRIS